MTTFGEWVRQHRGKLSQTEAARRARESGLTHMSQSRWSKIELDASDLTLSLDDVRGIARALDCREDEVAVAAGLEVAPDVPLAVLSDAKLRREQIDTLLQLYRFFLTQNGYPADVGERRPATS